MCLAGADHEWNTCRHKPVSCSKCCTHHSKHRTSRMKRGNSVGLLPLWLVAMILPCSTVHALFEDQAGTYDWYRPQVGGVTHAVFHKSKPRLYVSTEQGVAAALNLRDGTIAFRHKISTDGDNQLRSQKPGTAALLVDSPSAALLVTLTGSEVHAWEQTDGMHRWSYSIRPVHHVQHQPVLATVPGDAAAIAILGGGSLQVLNALDGTVQQSVQLSEAAAAQSVGLVHAEAVDRVVAYTFTPGQSALHITQLGTPEQLAAAGQHASSSSMPLSDIAAAGPAGWAALSQDYTALCTSGAGITAITCTSLDAATQHAVHGSERVKLVATATGWALASGNADKPGAALLSVTSDGGTHVVATFASASAVSQPLHVKHGEHIAFVEVQTAGAVVVQYVAVETGAVNVTEGPIHGARSEHLAADVTPPYVKAAFLGSYKKRDQSDGFRLLLVWSDERVASVQQGVTVWSRDEGLAGVTSALFSDLPPARHAAAAPSSRDFSQFMHLQLLGAKVQFKLATPEEVSEYAQLRATLSDKLLPTRDSRGFRRSLVVATHSGKVAALHNGDGHVIWSRPGPVSRKAGQSAAPQQLLHWLTYHDLQHAPQVALLWPSRDSCDSTLLSVLDAYTGKETLQQQLPYHMVKLVPIGQLATEGGHAIQQVYLAVQAHSGSDTEDKAPIVHLLPDTSITRSHFASHYRSLYFFLDTKEVHGAPDGKAAAFRGFGFDAEAARAISAGRPAAALPTWSLALPAPVISWGMPDPQEPVHTSVKVLGDRSMKYRYLNPNTLVVVTGLPPGAPAESPAADAVIYVVDAVTGAVRHHQTVPGCRGPATTLVTENLVAVQCWDATAARFVVVSLELYDATPREFSVLDHMFNPNATQPQTSFNPPPLEVLTSSFYTRTPAHMLLTTRTRAGITSKMLVLLTHTEQVYTLDMRFLDPRRPRTTKLTAEQQEERLLPYQDTLPLAPQGFASLNKQVLGLHGAVSAASRLESTSLLFAYGIDMQYTRLAPAKGFDSLDDDFSYGLLIMALLALLGGSIFMHFFTKNKMLKAKWQ